VRIAVGEPVVVPGNFGDTWCAALADDGNLYAPANDTVGFDIPPMLATREQVRLFQKYWETEDPADETVFFDSLRPAERAEFHRAFRPIAFTRIEGDDPHELRGATVNLMVEYTPEGGADDGLSWKSSGCTFVDGALYWLIARHRYPGGPDAPGLRQSAQDASFIRSTDHGRTWTRTHAENLAAPMFPGSSFATPYVVEGTPDGGFVYALSNNGFWDNGDRMILGRVPRDRLARLDGSTWEFRAGARWTADPEAAVPVLEQPGRLGATGAARVGDRYLLIGWYYPGGSGYFGRNSSSTVWNFYVADEPWGPWEHVHAHEWTPQGYYCPVVCPKFASGRRAYVVTSGDFKNWWDWYRLTLVPIELI
jgi:hypothetical protein